LPKLAISTAGNLLAGIAAFLMNVAESASACALLTARDICKERSYRGHQKWIFRFIGSRDCLF